MEKPKMSWETFTARKRLDVKAWCERHSITKYEELIKKCELMGIEAPSRKEVSFLSPKKAVSKPEEVKEQLLTTEETKEEPSESKKRRGRRKKTAVDTGDFDE